MDGAAFFAIAIVILVFVGLPIGLGLLIYFVPKKLGYPKAGKYLTIAYALLILFIAFRTFYENRKHDRKLRNSILLADREAPLGWVYLRIFRDSSFEFESRGLGSRGPVYVGKAKITEDSIFFYYQGSIPSAGSKAVYSDSYVEYTNGSYRERVEIKLNKLISK